MVQGKSGKVRKCFKVRLGNDSRKTWDAYTTFTLTGYISQRNYSLSMYI